MVPQITLKKKLKNGSTSHRYIWVILFATIVLTSCNKKLLNTTASSKKCKTKEVNFKYLTSKAKIDYKVGDNTTSFTANIRVKKDKVIWISASVFGFEGMRCLITEDSVKVKQSVPEKKYYCFSFDELSKRFNTTLSYDIIQSLLVGSKPIKKSKNETNIEGDNECVIVQVEPIFSVYNYLPYDIGQLNKVVVVSADSSNSLQIDYADFKLTGKYMFPFEALIQMSTKEQENSSLEINYKSANFTSKEMEFPFKVSDKYVRQ